jgi:acetate kinase
MAESIPKSVAANKSPGGPRRVLAINGGSSSLKFAIYEAGEPLLRLVHGKFERIGETQSLLTIREEGKPPESRPVTASDLGVAGDLLIKWIESRFGTASLQGVGHRVVHGGPKHDLPARVTPELLADLHGITSFDPEHLPGEILVMEEFQSRFPALPQVACFDTTFHREMPRVARILPIPRRYEAKGVRRYGFHGISYTFLMEELGCLGDPAAGRGRVILAHLGSGASLAAVKNGKSIDTSMGFTPASGVPMGTRSGDLDPGLPAFLAKTEGMGAEAFNTMINFQSGLLGISETGSDMRDLTGREKEDVRAAEAVEFFCYQIRKWIGAYVAALGGLDTLVFAGGIGENSPVIRARICEGLGFAGIELDAGRNGSGAGVISVDSSRVSVRVIQTDEERMIARTTLRALNIVS